MTRCRKMAIRDIRSFLSGSSKVSIWLGLAPAVQFELRTPSFRRTIRNWSFQMIDKRFAYATLFALCFVVSAIAQTSPDQQPPAPAPPPPAPTAWKLGGVDVSGMIDAYYSVGFNHPVGNVSGLRNFDDKANQMELNMAALTLDYGPKPVGFHVDVGVGRTFDIISATEKDVSAMRFFKQAYIDVKPASWKGLELDFGRFVTFASAEVIETPNNWNYSRSLLCVWCTPYYHFGFRATAPVGKQFTAGFQPGQWMEQHCHRRNL